MRGRKLTIEDCENVMTREAKGIAQTAESEEKNNVRIIELKQEGGGGGIFFENFFQLLKEKGKGIKN